MLYTFKITLRVSYAIAYDAVAEQQIFDNFLLSHTTYCARWGVTVEGRRSVGLHFLSEELPNNAPFLYSKDAANHETRIRMLVTYAFHHRNVEQQMIQGITRHAAIGLKSISEVFGGVLIGPDDASGDRGSTDL